MMDRGLAGLGVHPYAERDQGLEEGAEEGAIAHQELFGALAPEKRTGVNSGQVSRQRRISKMVLGCLGETAEPISRRQPPRNWVDEVETFKHVSVGDGGRLRRLLCLSRGRRTQQFVVGRGGGGSRGICREPCRKCGGSADREAEFGEITINHA